MSSPAPQSTVTSSSAALYVGQLDPTVTEAMLFELFNMIGPVSSIRVCRDAVTRRSLCYAYVNYLNANDAQQALKQLNYSIIKDRPCRIMWSQRDPALRKTGRGNIFIRNLLHKIDNKELHKMFATFGDVLSCKVATDEHNHSKGYGFVQYETTEAADNAIEALNGSFFEDTTEDGSIIETKKLYVGHYVSRKERQSKIDEQKAQFTNLYVKNIDSEVTKAELKEHFQRFGNVASAVIQVDNEDRRFGFVNYENHEDAQSAVDKLHDTEWKGRKLFISRAQKKAEREEELRRSYEQAKMEKFSKHQGVNLYIKNLVDSFDDEKLRAEFEPFGAVTSCKVMRDDAGTSKGFGFVCFSSPDAATKAITEMNNKMIETKPLYVSLAQRREVRRQQLESVIAERHQIKQQAAAAAAAGLPGGYINGPPSYPLGDFPPQGGHGVIGHEPPGMYPHYPPNNGQGMPIPMPYGQAPSQGFGMSGFPHDAVPHLPNDYGGPGISLINALIHHANAPAPLNGTAPHPQAPNIYVFLVHPSLQTGPPPPIGRRRATNPRGRR